MIFHKYREQIAYLFFGVVTTAVSWGMHGLLIRLGVPLFVTNILAWIGAVTVAFFTNRWWVFHSEAKGFRNVLNKAIALFGSRAALGLLEIVGIPVLVGIGLDGLVFSTEGFDARLIISVIVVIGNYFIGKFWVFKNDSKSHQA